MELNLAPSVTHNVLSTRGANGRQLLEGFNPSVQLRETRSAYFINVNLSAAHAIHESANQAETHVVGEEANAHDENEGFHDAQEMDDLVGTQSDELKQTEEAAPAISSVGEERTSPKSMEFEEKCPSDAGPPKEVGNLHDDVRQIPESIQVSVPPQEDPSCSAPQGELGRSEVLQKQPDATIEMAHRPDEKEDTEAQQKDSPPQQIYVEGSIQQKDSPPQQINVEGSIQQMDSPPQEINVERPFGKSEESRKIPAEESDGEGSQESSASEENDDDDKMSYLNVGALLWSRTTKIMLSVLFSSVALITVCKLIRRGS